MTLAKQASVLPTNKLAFGSAITAIVGTQLSPMVAELWPGIAPPLFAGPAFTDILATLTALLAGVVIGWFIPDRAQIVEGG